MKTLKLFSLLGGLLLFGISATSFAGGREGHGGGDDVFEQIEFTIQDGTKVQQEIWREALNMAEKICLTLYENSKDIYYSNLRSSLKKSPYLITAEPLIVDGRSVYAKTMVPPDLPQEETFRLPTLISTTIVSADHSLEERWTLALHEALHRLHPAYTEDEIKNEFSQKVDVPWKAYLQFKEKCPSEIIPAETFKLLFEHAAWQGECEEVDKESFKTTGFTGICTVSFNNRPISINSNIWGYSNLSMDVQVDLKKKVTKRSWLPPWNKYETEEFMRFTSSEILLRAKKEEPNEVVSYLHWFIDGVDIFASSFNYHSGLDRYQYKFGLSLALDGSILDGMSFVSDISKDIYSSDPPLKLVMLYKLKPIQ